MDRDKNFEPVPPLPGGKIHDNLTYMRRVRVNSMFFSEIEVQKHANDYILDGIQLLYITYIWRNIYHDGVNNVCHSTSISKTRTASTDAIALPHHTDRAGALHVRVLEFLS